MSSVEFLRNDAFLTAEVLKLALESSGVGVWKVDPRTRSVELSAAMKHIFGIPLESGVDYEMFFQLLHPDDRDRARAGLASAFDPAGTGRSEVEFRILTPASETKWLLGRGQAFFEGPGQAGAPTLFIGTLSDVTAGKAVEAVQRALMEQQQIMIHEVNHRVKNSLQLVSSLLRLQSRRIGDAASRRPLEDAINRISTIGHIHERLYREQDTKRINFGAFLSELCADLQASSPHCKLEVRTQNLMIATDRAIPLALVVNELVTNAFKYAYPGGAGPVRVEVECLPTGDFDILVSDQGAGLPDGFSVESTKSLGMVLIASLINQVEGRIEIRRTGPGGTCFVVTAPTQPVANA